MKRLFIRHWGQTFQERYKDCFIYVQRAQRIITIMANYKRVKIMFNIDTLFRTNNEMEFVDKLVPLIEACIAHINLHYGDKLRTQLLLEYLSKEVDNVQIDP